MIMNDNQFFQSKIFRVATWMIAGLILLLLVFKIGLSIGYKKAGFSYRWGENYHRNFAGPRGGFFNNFKNGFGDRNFINAHGIFGSIIKIEGNAIIVKSRDDVEKIILVKDNTTITRFRDKAQLSDIKVDDNIVIIGEPNEVGQIEAKFIRVMPLLPRPSH